MFLDFWRRYSCYGSLVDVPIPDSFRARLILVQSKRTPGRERTEDSKGYKIDIPSCNSIIMSGMLHVLVVCTTT